MEGARPCGLALLPSGPAFGGEALRMNARFALVGRLTLLLSVFLLALYGVGLWVEGEKEAHILCGLVQIGESETEVRRLFGTAALMQVANDTVRGEAGIRAEAAVGPSYYRCRFGVRDGAVVSTSRGGSCRPKRSRCSSSGRTALGAARPRAATPGRGTCVVHELVGARGGLGAPRTDCGSLHPQCAAVEPGQASPHGLASSVLRPPSLDRTPRPLKLRSTQHRPDR